MTDTPLSKKLSSIAALLNPNSMKPQILSANIQLMSLVKDVKTLEEENAILRSKIQPSRPE
jgi:hypothetical protein